MIPAVRNLPYEVRLKKLGLWSELILSRSTKLYMAYLQSSSILFLNFYPVAGPEVIR